MEKINNGARMRDTYLYVTDDSADGIAGKLRDAAYLSLDGDAVKEANEVIKAIGAEDEVRTAITSSADINFALGDLSTRLRDSYQPDSELVEAGITKRVVVYREEEIKVDDDATLAPLKDAEKEVLDEQGRIRTLHGYLERKTLDDARGALYLEAVENIAALQSVADSYAVRELKELFKTPLIFEVKYDKPDV